MSRAILLAAPAIALCVMGCLGNGVVDCSYGSDSWVQWQAEQFANRPGAATVACLGAKNSGPNLYPTMSVPPMIDAGAAPDGCVPCIVSDCKAPLLACNPADGGARCEAPEPAYTALASCVAASCSPLCQGVP